MNVVTDFIRALGLDQAPTYVALFIAASLLMIWRLDAMGKRGLEGTALGTLITPYCSGFGNLVFVYLILRDHGKGSEVMTNCLVNNVTNLTFVLGAPALIWPLSIGPNTAKAKSNKKSKSSGKVETERRISRLSLLLTMAAVVFFTGATWVLGERGQLDVASGTVLVGLFLFWQCFQVIDVMKHNVRQKRSFGPAFYLDFLLVLIGAAVSYISLDWLVTWLSQHPSGFLSAAHLGWLSGWLTVLPNAILAFYYAAKSRGDIVYSSQIGDGHICIPLCVGLYALARPLPLTSLFEPSLVMIGAALAVHFGCLIFAGRLPRPVAGGLVVAYGYFVYSGMLS